VSAHVLDLCEGAVAELFSEFDVAHCQHFPPPNTHSWQWTFSGGLQISLQLESDGPRWRLDPPTAGQRAARRALGAS